MRTFRATLFLLASTNSLLAATPWEEYLALPSPANAARVAALTYSPATAPPGGYARSDIRVLEDQVLAQDSEAFQLLLRLYRASGGGLAEELGVRLGHSSRVHPEFFLRQVLASQRPCSELAWPLNAPGEQYVDRPGARRYEIEARRAALGAVNTEALARVRRECLAAFKQK